MFPIILSDNNACTVIVDTVDELQIGATVTKVIKQALDSTLISYRLSQLKCQFGVICSNTSRKSRSACAE